MLNSEQVKGGAPQARIANWIAFRVKGMVPIDGTPSSR